MDGDNPRKTPRGTKARNISNQEHANKKPAKNARTGTNSTRRKRDDMEDQELFNEYDDEELDNNVRTKQDERDRRQDDKSTSQKNRSSSMNHARTSARQARLKVADVHSAKSEDELEENRKLRRSPRLRQQRITRSSIKENDDEDYVEKPIAADPCNTFDFKNLFEKIVGKSMGESTNDNNVSSSRKQSQIMSKKKYCSASTRNDRNTQNKWKNLKENSDNDDDGEGDDDNDQRNRRTNKKGPNPEEEEYPDDQHGYLNFDRRSPNVNLSRATDSGFFDKTASTAGKKRTYDKQDQTPGSARSDTRDETPGDKITRKAKRIGRLDVQTSASHTPRRGYRSNDDKRTSKLQESPEINFFSQPTPSNQRNRKRKGENDVDLGFKSGSSAVAPERQRHKKVSRKEEDDEHESNAIEDLGDDEYMNESTSFKTPLDKQSNTMQPRKLFQSTDQSTNKKRRILRDSRDDEDYDDDDLSDADDFNDSASLHKEVQMTLAANFENDVRKSIKQKQDYLKQMAATAIKLVSGKTQTMWEKQSSKRNLLMTEFTKRVNKYIEEYQNITSRGQAIEDNMFLQLETNLDSLAKNRKEQEKCMQCITKIQKAFAETFKNIEDATQSQQTEFQNNFRKELARHRNEAVAEVQKQEIGQIQRRIQAMFGMSL